MRLGAFFAGIVKHPLHDHVPSSELLRFSQLCSFGVAADVCCIAYDAANRLLAVGSFDGSLKIFGQAGVEHTLEQSEELRGQPVSQVSFVGGRLLNVGQDTISVWDLERLSFSGTTKFEFDISAPVLPHPGTHYVYVACIDGTVHVYDTKACACTSYRISLSAVVASGTSGTAGAPAVTSVLTNTGEEGHILVGYTFGTVISWDLKNRKTVRRYTARDTGAAGVRGTFDRLMSTACHPAGKYIAAGFESGKCAIWQSSKDGLPVLILGGRDNPVASLSPSPSPSSSPVPSSISPASPPPISGTDSITKMAWILNEELPAQSPPSKAGAVSVNPYAELSGTLLCIGGHKTLLGPQSGRGIVCLDASSVFDKKAVLHGTHSVVDFAVMNSVSDPITSRSPALAVLLPGQVIGIDLSACETLAKQQAPSAANIPVPPLQCSLLCPPLSISHLRQGDISCQSLYCEPDCPDALFAALQRLKRDAPVCASVQFSGGALSADGLSMDTAMLMTGHCDGSIVIWDASTPRVLLPLIIVPAPRAPPQTTSPRKKVEKPLPPIVIPAATENSAQVSEDNASTTQPVGPPPADTLTSQPETVKTADENGAVATKRLPEEKPDKLAVNIADDAQAPDADEADGTDKVEEVQTPVLQAAVTCISIDPDGKFVVAGYSSGHLAVFFAPAAEPVSLIVSSEEQPPEESSLESVEPKAHMAGPPLVSNALCLGEARYLMKFHPTAIRSISASSVINRIASGDESGVVSLVDSESGKCIMCRTVAPELPSGSISITSVTMGPAPIDPSYNGCVVLVGVSDGSVRLFKPSDGSPLPPIKPKSASPVLSLFLLDHLALPLLPTSTPTMPSLSVAIPSDPSPPSALTPDTPSSSAASVASAPAPAPAPPADVSFDFPSPPSSNPSLTHLDQVPRAPSSRRASWFDSFTSRSRSSSIVVNVNRDKDTPAAQLTPTGGRPGDVFVVVAYREHIRVYLLPSRAMVAKVACPVPLTFAGLVMIQGSYALATLNKEGHYQAYSLLALKPFGPSMDLHDPSHHVDFSEDAVRRATLSTNGRLFLLSASASALTECSLMSPSESELEAAMLDTSPSSAPALAPAPAPCPYVLCTVPAAAVPSRPPPPQPKKPLAVLGALFGGGGPIDYHKLFALPPPPPKASRSPSPPQPPAPPAVDPVPPKSPDTSLTERQLLGLDPRNPSPSPAAASTTPNNKDKAQGKLMAGIGSLLGDTKNALFERGEKLEKLGDASTQLENEASNFADLARKLREREENKKWWEL